MKRLLSLIILVSFILIGCGPSEDKKSTQTAISVSETAASWTRTPTNSNTPPTIIVAVSTKLLSTSTLIPSVLKYPTFTPIPSPTSFVLTPFKRSYNYDNGNPPSTYCSAYLEYVDAMHQYYLDIIDYVHQPMIDYYENLLKQLLEKRDGLEMIRVQEKLDNEKAQIAAEKAAENKRYEAELAYVKANCR